jgi:protein-S-isoprenylcysteine O-methyltransferase Ste14
MKNLFSLLRSLLVAALFIWLQMWLLPRWVGIRGDWHAPQAEPLRWLGLLPLVCGSILMLTCVWRFGTTGQGTPAPFDPPRKFVAVGPYRYVRNPMYLGMALALIGEAILFADRASLVRIVVYGLALVVIVVLFVLLYEEPSLRRRFGFEYEAYCRKVPRWFPAKP